MTTPFCSKPVVNTANLRSVWSGPPTPTNDNCHVRLTIRHDRATVVAVGSPEFGPRLARLFTGADSAGATEYAHEIAEVLGTRVQYVVIDRGTERSGWLPVAHHQERAS